MNYCVPDFGIEEEDPFTSSIQFPNCKLLQDEGDGDLAEIIWQKGPVLRQFPLPDRSFDVNQNRVCGEDAANTATGTAACDLFMGEDEMASWLHYSPDNITANAKTENQQVLEHHRTVMAASSSQQRSTTTSMLTQPRVMESLLVASRASTVVDSNVVIDSAAVKPLQSRDSTDAAATERNDVSLVSEKLAASSSMPTHGDDRKRKIRDSDYSDGEDADYDSDDKKKDNRRPTRRTRAAEVHNLSERRRRDRINEKMKALQQLIPRCNKSDKASMLDDAVEYLKSLQLQIQIMSMGCQMMYSGIPQYAAPVGVPMRMGVDPMLQFPQVMPGGSVQGNTAAHLSSRLPIPATTFHPAAAMAVNGQLGVQTTRCQPDQKPNFVYFRGPNPSAMPNLTSPFTQYYGFQLPLQQNPTEPGASNQQQNQKLRC